jgi:ABC-type polysaccharide/polyol phosphate transport system ATPase subunit
LRSTVSRPAVKSAAADPGAPAAVSVKGVSKAFKLPHRQYHTLKERALHPFHVRTFDVLQAVDDVSFEVAPGEFFGIVGRNGSGKSTLLKCLAGIYDLDAGELEVSGRLSPFIELGVGFNPDLTARDNVIINAIMLGLTRQRARERFDEIIAFAELEEFLDLRLKNYSSGMIVRLAFSIAIQVDADILLIDEVLAVGDATFQQKCFDEFHRLKAEGRTILFVTHSMGDVQRFCDRAMLLERGAVVEIGDPAPVSRRYNELNFGRMLVDGAGALSAGGEKAAEILDVWFEDPDGRRIAAVAQDQPCCACLKVQFNAPLEDPIFGVALRNDTGHTVFATTTALEHGPTGSFGAGEMTTVRLRFENWLAAGRYNLTPSVARNGPGDDIVDIHKDVISLIVHGDKSTPGIARLPHGFELERG